MRFWRKLFTALVLISLVLAYGLFIEPKQLKIEDIYLDYRLGGQSIKVVQFSDTHLGRYYTGCDLAKLINAINAQEPDIVVFCGDLFDQADKYTDTAAIAPLLAQIEAPLGKFAVWGNHDYGGGAENIYATILSDGGFTVLVNAQAELNLDDGQTLTLIGLDDLLFGEPDYSLVAQSSAPTILLVHEPDAITQLNTTELPFLTLSGHSHGGQVRLPLLGSPIKTVYAHHYSYKLYNLAANSYLYVNTGIGTTTIPLRLGVAPSISVFYLQI